MTTPISQQLGSLPIQVVFDNGRVGFAKMGRFPLIVDQPEPYLQALITEDAIYIGSGTEILYNEFYDIESIPELKAYLVALKVISSVNEQGE